MRCTPWLLPGVLWIAAVLSVGELEATEPKEPRRRNSSTPGPGGVANDASERELGESGPLSGVVRVTEVG